MNIIKIACASLILNCSTCEKDGEKCTLCESTYYLDGEDTTCVSSGSCAGGEMIAADYDPPRCRNCGAIHEKCINCNDDGECV